MIEERISSETNIAKKLLEIGAIKFQPNDPFTWASGIKSPIYCDNRQTLSFPSVRNLIAKSFTEKTKEYLPFDTIAGVATGGIAHGMLVADRLNYPFIYVRSGKKAHGTGRQVEGYFEKGQSCVVIEDLISTGKSSLEAVEALREVGLKVKVVLSIFSYGLEEAVKAFNNKNCAFESLSQYSTLLDIATENKSISKVELKELKSWRRDPRNWKK